MFRTDDHGIRDGAPRSWLSLDLFFCELLFGLPWFLYSAITRLWLTFDDAFFIHFVATREPRHYLFEPAQWHPIPMFTPVLPLVYEVDFHLFGLNLEGFYLHHLLELSACALLLYAALRLWFRELHSAAAVVLIFAGAPFSAWATQLMVRHYVEATIAGAASLICFVLAMRGRPHARRLTALSVLAYFVAICAKEVAIPLIVLFALIPEGSWRTRLLRLRGHVLVLLLVMIWRRLVLGTLLTGYGWAVTNEMLPRLVVQLPGKIVAMWLGSNAISGGMLVLLLAVMSLAAFRSRRGALVAIAAMGMAVAPVLPVSTQVEPRYAVVPWLAFVIVAMSGFDKLSGMGVRRRTRAILLFSTIVLALVVNRRNWTHVYADALRMSAEARAVVELPPGAVIRDPLVPPSALGETRWIREVLLHHPPGVSWSYDDLYFCGRALPARIVHYENGVTDVTAKAKQELAAFCAAPNETGALSADLKFAHGALFWELGPYRDGAYRFLLADGVQAFDVPRSGGFQLDGMSSITLRIRHKTIDGSATYSPSLTMNFARQPTLHWERAGGLDGTRAPR